MICGSDPLRSASRTRSDRKRQPSESSGVDPVIRSLAHDMHLVDMALAEAGAGAADEWRMGAHLLDRPVGGIAQGGAETADTLVNHIAGRARVGHRPLDTFGHQLVRGVEFFLE